MRGWTAVALALAEPGAGGLGSRLSKYLHPLAGRPLAWHTLCAAASASPPPDAIVIVGPPELSPGVFDDLAVPVRAVDRASTDPCGDAALPEDGGVLVLDAAAVAPPPALHALVAGPEGTLLEDPSARPLAAWLGRAEACALLASGGGLASLSPVARVTEPEGFVVESRAELARATACVRDRLVAALMEAGATFLLPETVLVDVDVRIGRDAVVYPNVVLEGQTTIGDETVIGPGCRIVDSWIGSGVELKGFNYLSHTSIRNRAILEPHVRRGFD